MDATEQTGAIPTSTPTKSTPAKATQKAAAEEDKRSITLTFQGDDLNLYADILKDAESDERTPSGLLLRFIRKNYKAGDEE